MKNKKLYSVLGNSQKLDGGAMFGNAPKAVWQKWVKVDEHNRIDLVCRALLVKENHRNILFETGIGAFFEPKMRQRYGVVEEQHVLLESLAQLGLSHQDIDLVVLSHLHFDHAGGLLSQWQADSQAELLFPNADILVGKQAWERGLNPHHRDKASFVAELMNLLKNYDRLHLVEQEQHAILGEDYRFHLSHGHTPGMLLTEITMPDGPILFCADLIPGSAWVHLPITMGYDRYAELLINEKETLLQQWLEKNGRLYFTHDPQIAIGQVEKNAQGKYAIANAAAELQGLAR